VGPDGVKSWHQHDKLHRDNDRPAMIDRYGDLHWYQHDVSHRENGPAIVLIEGNEYYYINGVEIKKE
jgi:hypothetical protein